MNALKAAIILIIGALCILYITNAMAQEVSKAPLKELLADESEQLELASGCTLSRRHGMDSEGMTTLEPAVMCVTDVEIDLQDFVDEKYPEPIEPKEKQ